MTREAQKEEESTESREQKHQVEVVEVKPPALEVSPADGPKGSFEQKAEQDVGAAGVKVESVKTQEQISTEKKVQKIVSQNLEVSASTPEIKKESKAPRVGPESSSTKASKKDESAGPESSLVRWLRSHTPQQKASSSEADPKSNTESNAHRQKKRKKHAKASVKDDASRIKMRVRYLLNRINREQNLIDVYSADGWKGQSLEKLRPEQELKRAERQILRCKLGIRQELQQLHTLSLEGSIQDTAFDPEGQIYFDDIFCAICKSKEVLPENDIILCDGACNRAFHQFCLEPPLRTEDIPPGDDGWLCPICDCKFDCLDAINDHLGTDFEMEDNWEKVFAEAEDVAHAGDNLVGSLVDWPSEDSEDDDYNPEKAKLSEHDGSARESGSNDADDSDSDLDSDSDSDSDSNSSDNSSGVVFFDEFAGTARGKKRPLSEDDETEELLREHVEEDAVLVSGKRQRMDIDYKQLYDEVYGAYASDYDSSEDEDWGKKKQSKGLKESDQHMEGSVSEAKQGKGKNGEVFEAVDVSQRKKSPMKLPTEVVAKLQEIFNECELPSKARKQALSSQMGLPFADVNTWFKNARRTASRKKKLGEGGNASGLSSDSGAQPAGKEESVCTGTTRHESAGD